MTWKCHHWRPGKKPGTGIFDISTIHPELPCEPCLTYDNEYDREEHCHPHCWHVPEDRNGCTCPEKAKTIDSPAIPEDLP